MRRLDFFSHPRAIGAGVVGILVVLLAASRAIIWHKQRMLTALQPEEPAFRVYLDAFSDAELRRLARLSRFDVPIGGRLGGIIPVVDVPEAERAHVRTAWEPILRTPLHPANPAKVAWRKVLRSVLVYPGGRSAPPESDRSAAGWAVPGPPPAEVRVSGTGAWAKVTVTVELRGNERIPFRGPQGYEPQVLTESSAGGRIDKARLLDVLNDCLRTPWKTPDDFVVNSSPSPKPPGYHLSVETFPWSLPRSPPHGRNSAYLQIEGDDPQRVSFSVVHQLPYEGD